MSKEDISQNILNFFSKDEIKPYFLRVEDMIQKGDFPLEKVKKYLLDEFIKYSLQTKVTFGFRYTKNKENILRGRVGRYSGFRTGTRRFKLIPGNEIPVNRNPDETGLRYYDFGRGSWRSFKKDMFVVCFAFWSEELNKWCESPEEAKLTNQDDNYKYKRINTPLTEEQKKLKNKAAKKDAEKREREIKKMLAKYQ